MRIFYLISLFLIRPSNVPPNGGDQYMIWWLHNCDESMGIELLYPSMT
jgi:hypothetical protein